MTSPEPKTRRRIHVGNISPALRQNGAALSTRMAKYGPMVGPLEFHGKPAGEHYFAYADMELGDRDLERLKAALNGILYMGRKISIGVAKPAFDVAWKKDHCRPAPAARALAKQEGIALARAARIREAAAHGHCNSATGAPVAGTCPVGATLSSQGYMKSAHTFHDLSGNTKHKSPAHSLVGARSYGSTLVPKGSCTQQYSRTSGRGDVVRGRVRKTARPPAYFVRKQQTMRVLINGELKQLRCYKTKLWGVEQRSALDLTYRYADGSWRSGDDHVVERSVGARRHAAAQALAHASCGVSGDQALAYGALATACGDAGDADDAAPDAGLPCLDDERAKNTAVLARLFSTFDFNKETPVEMEDVSDDEGVSYDSKGRKTVPRFDFEVQGSVAPCDSDSEDAGDIEMAVVEEFRSSAQRPPEEVYYSESDEGNDIDMDALQQLYTTEAIKTHYDVEHEDTQAEHDGGATLEMNDDTALVAAAVPATLPSSGCAEVSSQPSGSPEASPGSTEAISGSSSFTHSSKSLNSSDSSDESSDPSDESSDPSDESSDSSDDSSDSSDDSSESSDDSSESSDDSSESSDESSESSADSSNSTQGKEGQQNDLAADAAEDSEEDLMPKFSAPPTTSTTETLRSLFNQSQNQHESTGFSLAVPHDDIDEEKHLHDEAERQKLLEQIRLKQEEEDQKAQEYANPNKRKFGLFWSHSESPFLQSQTQLSKIGHFGQRFRLPGESEDASTREIPEGEEDDYEKWFWSMRGEVGRECKKKRREATKNMKKRNVRAYV